MGSIDPVFMLLRITTMPDKNEIKNPRCEFYQRYPNLNPQSMQDSRYWTTYHRSQFKRPPGAQAKANSFHPDQPEKKITEASKTGTYYSPFHFSGYKQAVKPSKRGQAVIYPNNSYDELLAYQRQMANYIVKKMTQKALGLSVNADNDYTCVLVKFPMPTEAKPVDWINTIILHFIAIANYLSEEKGLNCELVRRSGFGHLRPSVCETAPSLRINVGFIPKVYADILVSALEKTHALFCGEHRKVFDHKPSIPTLHDNLLAYNEARKLKNARKLVVQSTLWKNLWAKFDAKGRSLIAQVMRRQITAEWIINTLTDGLRKHESVPDDADTLMSVIVPPWLTILSNVGVNSVGKKKVLSIQPPAESLPSYQWRRPALDVNDPEFTLVLTRLYAIYDLDTHQNPAQKTLQGLHEYLETASRNVFFNPVMMKSADGYGSDSDIEDEVYIAQKPVGLHVKKITTATGMRAIQLTFAAVKLYWQEQSTLNFRNLQVATNYMYYETKDALTKHAIPIELKSLDELAATSNVEMHLYDLNHCNTRHKATPAVAEQIPDTFPICVLDTTSASTKKMAVACEELFAKPNISTIILVSSGLKNEQAGSDLNPYGTIRIMSRSAKERDAIYRQVCALEKKAEYQHPGVSHLLRKNAKLRDLLPTTLGIFKHMSHEAKVVDKPSVNLKIMLEINSYLQP